MIKGNMIYRSGDHSSFAMPGCRDGGTAVHFGQQFAAEEISERIGLIRKYNIGHHGKRITCFFDFCHVKFTYLLLLPTAVSVAVAAVSGKICSSESFTLGWVESAGAGAVVFLHDENLSSCRSID